MNTGEFPGIDRVTPNLGTPPRIKFEEITTSKYFPEKKFEKVHKIKGLNTGNCKTSIANVTSNNNFRVMKKDYARKSRKPVRIFDDFGKLKSQVNMSNIIPDAIPVVPRSMNT